MKLSTFSASAINGSNEVLTSQDLSTVREGSFFKFQQDDIFYTVASTKKKEFSILTEGLEKNKIKVDRDISTLLFVGDEIKIIHKEYKLSSILGIVDKGSGYERGQILEVQGGKLLKNIIDDSFDCVKLRVVSVNEKGGIENLEILSNGSYSITPTQNLSFGNATISLNFTESPISKIIEREVTKIIKVENYYIVYLNYDLPYQVKDAVIYYEKWCLYLTTSYSNKSKTNESCLLIRDYTGNYGFPLAAKNTLSPEGIYNLFLTMMDQKIKELEERIKKLEK